MAIRTELTLRLQNSPGTLARVCDLLASERVNLLAMMLDTGGTMRLLVDNPTLAAGLLQARHYEVVSHEVLFVQIGNEAGAFAKLARMLAASGVNLDYVYATAPEKQRDAAIIIGVPDAMRAAAAAGL